MPKLIDKFLIRKAIRHLRSSDGVLSDIISIHGPCTIAPALDNPFHALTSSIISQQLSARAARAIKARLFDLLRAQHFESEIILKIPAEKFQAAGLSRAKVDYIRGLALAFRKGEFDVASLAECKDEDVITRLVRFPGIGRWTAEMFLIFGLGRPDVLSVNDAGLKRAFRAAYHLPQIPSSAEMIELGEPWRPYRSIASWYLWRVVD